MALIYCKEDHTEEDFILYDQCLTRDACGFFFLWQTPHLSLFISQLLEGENFSMSLGSIMSSGSSYTWVVLSFKVMKTEGGDVTACAHMAQMLEGLVAK